MVEVYITKKNRVILKKRMSVTVLIQDGPWYFGFVLNF